MTKKIRKSLLCIQNIQRDIKEKQNKIEVEINEIIKTLKPALNILPKKQAITFLCFDNKWDSQTIPLKVAILMVVEYHLANKTRSNGYGFISIEDISSDDLKQIVNKLNQILFEINLVSEINIDFPSAFNILIRT